MTSPLTMTVSRPAGRLGEYVRAFQVFTITEPDGASVLDFGGADVSVPVCFGDPVLVEDWGRCAVPSTAVVGPRTQAVWLRFQGTIDQVNISFFPGAAGAFVGMSMPELVGRMASPDDVWPRAFREAVAELQPLPAAQRICGLANLLLARLEPSREPRAQVREAVRLIQARRGRVTVRWLASQVNLSISQLERSFTRQVGVGPKLLARQTRICALAAEAMKLADPGWASLAAKYGYADQAHLAREFRELTGLTPSMFASAGSDADFLQDALACRRGVYGCDYARANGGQYTHQPILIPRPGVPSVRDALRHPPSGHPARLTGGEGPPRRPEYPSLTAHRSPIPRRAEMPAQQQSPALTVARALVAAWSAKDWDTARSMLAPDVHVIAITTNPGLPHTDLTGADEYMKGLVAFADPIVPGTVHELASAGDERNALVTLDLRVAGGPFGDGVQAPCARLYLVENGKIKTEQVVFYVGQG